ncbi:hypothetical protein H4217_000649 [Coemansia sp. RSA 1939]|nr:hypothetical protein H4217_000649 [Coemansia sp. RSA 1939]KAJ2615161.1 hypothetical protein EV177_001699 [Coemansia sp. RSA 1804]
MSINLDQQTTYQLRLGVSMQKNTGSISDNVSSAADGPDGSSNEDSGFHLVSRNLPRTTTKLCRETLEAEPSLRARLLSLPGKGNSNGKEAVLPAIFETTARDQKTVCTYEGDYVNVLHASDESGSGNGNGDAAGDASDDEVDCVLIYDEENKAFVIERVASRTSIKTSSQSSGVGSSGTAASGSLALPTNQYDPSKTDSAKNAAGPTSGVRREPTIDEAAEDELAKELEGMLDDGSDFGGGPLRANDNPGSADKQYSMEATDYLDEALFEEAASDDDEFEEVDNVQFLEDDDGAGQEERNNNKSSVADDDDMLFEEIDPSAELGSGSGSGGGNMAGHGSGSIAEEDFEFEDVGSPNITSLSITSGGGGGADDALFGGSFTSSPNIFQQPGQGSSGSGAQQSLMSQTTSPTSAVSGYSVSRNMPSITEQDTETIDEFDDLDFDLTQSLQES